MWFAQYSGRSRESPSVRIVNVAGRVGIQIIQGIVETTDGVAPARSTNPVLGLNRRSVQGHWHFESELSVIEVVEVRYYPIGPVVVATLDRFVVGETQPGPIGGKPLGHP